MSDRNSDYDTTYTRVRFHAQRGDGPDQRGDVTVEVQQAVDEGSAEDTRRAAEAQFSAAVDYLEDELGLQDGG